MKSVPAPARVVRALAGVRAGQGEVLREDVEFLGQKLTVQRKSPAREGVEQEVVTLRAAAVEDLAAREGLKQEVIQQKQWL